MIELADDLLAANLEFARRSDTFSIRERLVADAQMDVAVESLRALADQPPGGRSKGQAEVALATREAGNSVRQEPGAVKRSVQITVAAVSPSSIAAPLDVYALPLGVLLNANKLSEAKLQFLLESLRFKQRTSPSVDQLESGGDFALWVAQPDRVEAVTAIVRRGLPFPRRVVRASDPAPLAIEFDEASQLSMPAEAVFSSPRRRSK